MVQSCPVSLVFLKMAKHNVNRMPVIESKNSHKIKGWITRSDVMRCYWMAKSKKIHQEYEETLFERYEGTMD